MHLILKVCFYILCMQQSVKIFSIATVWLFIMFVNVWVGDISADIKTEPDISECPHVDVPSTGMFVFMMSKFCVLYLL